MSLNVNKTLRKAKSLARKGDTPAARALYEQVLHKFPANKQAAQGLAALAAGPAGPLPGSEELQQFQLALQDLVRLFNAGHARRALEQAQQLVARYPAEPVLHNLIGAAHTELQQYEAAIAAYERAIDIQPDYAEAFSNLGAACNEIGRHDAAIAAYRRAIELEPRFHEAHNNLGNVYRDCRQLDEALASYRQAIELKPDFAAAHNNLGCALSDLGRYAEGAESCARALNYRPDFGKARGMLLHQLAQMCDWPAIEAMRDRIPELGTQGEPVIPFELLQLEDAPERHYQRSVRFARQSFHKQPRPDFERPDERPERLRIGYFSADFNDHATMYLMARLFELHDSARYEIHAFSNSVDDGGDMHQRLKTAVHAYHDINTLSDAEAADLARREGLHIAVDLKGYTRGARLGALAHYAAPIQMTWIGYPGTTGLAAIDYNIGDAIVIPPGQEIHYSEKIIRLTDSYQVNDNTRPVAGHCPTREDAGLPANGFVFCCFNNNNKIGPREFDIWMRLLAQVPDSVLWLFKSNDWAQSNLRKEASKRGIDEQRIVFAERVSHSEHLARHALADLSLDTFNYNAHTTTSDALWSGLPVVTRIGQGFAARVGASLLRAVGLPQLISESEEAYEALALQLAQDPEQLAALREQLRSNRDQAALFNSEKTTREIELAYDRAFQYYREGKAAEHIDLSR